MPNDEDRPQIGEAPADNAEDREEEPAAEESERPLREISEDELQSILADHKKWLETSGKVGQKADLSGRDLRAANLRLANLKQADLSNTDLRGAFLHGANLEGALLANADLREAHLRDARLQGAELSFANLQNARLIETDLQGADLSGADLRWAYLHKANFDNRPKSTKPAADLTNATLRDADLSDAKLSTVTGLQTGMLAGANLSNATVSDEIGKFEGLAHVTEISKHARNIFLAVVGGCVFSWLTIATTTDAALLTNSGSSPLPIIQTKVPIAGFYWAAPAILLALYCYLHLYLQRLWEGMASLPAIFPDGRTLDERAYPWLLSGIVRAHVPRLRKDRPSFSRLQVLFSILSAWILVPWTIGLFWLRYLPIHDWIGTDIHVVLLTLAVTVGVAFYWRARATLRGQQRDSSFFWTLVKRAGSFVGSVAIGVFFALVSYGAIGPGVNRDDGGRVALKGVEAWVPYAFERVGNGIYGDLGRALVTGFGSWVPSTFEAAGYRTYADLREVDVSTKPDNWSGLGKEPDELSPADLAEVKGAQLEARDLVNARAFGTFFLGAKLSRANLQRAKLSRANLQGAYLIGANLREVDFTHANLQGAKLFRANLQRAILFEANLQGADLSNADLQGATS